jgi:hypothetical protein
MLIADITSLRTYLHLFVIHLEQTGIGALPLPIPLPEPRYPFSSPDFNGLPLPDIKDEATLITDTSAFVNALYARKKQIEENNGIIASLLGAQGSASTAGGQSQALSQTMNASQGPGLGRQQSLGHSPSSELGSR